jgi:hypothetical protein
LNQEPTQFCRKKKCSGLKAEVSLRRTKYFLLVIFIVAALTGLSLAFLMDPMSLLTRFYTFFIYPLVLTLINLSLDLVRPLEGFGPLGGIPVDGFNCVVAGKNPVAVDATRLPDGWSGYQKGGLLQTCSRAGYRECR